MSELTADQIRDLLKAQEEQVRTLLGEIKQLRASASSSFSSSRHISLSLALKESNNDNNNNTAAHAHQRQQTTVKQQTYPPIPPVPRAAASSLSLSISSGDVDSDVQMQDADHVTRIASEKLTTITSIITIPAAIKIENDTSVLATTATAPSSATSSTLTPTAATFAASTTSSSSSNSSGSGGSVNATTDSDKKRRFRKTCLMIWSKLAEHRYGNVFTRAEKSPYYLNTIKCATNLMVIKNRIRDGEISTMEEFHRDILLMIANAVMFNEENSEIYLMAKTLLVFIQEELAALENVRRLKEFMNE